MASELIDITVSTHDGMIVYEGDPEVRLERAQSIEAGAVANVSRLDFGVHSGTHVDAPVHFLPGASGVEALPLEACVGPAVVVDATGVDQLLDERRLASLGLPDAERVLFKTRNSELWERSEFTHEFVQLSKDAADYLVAREVHLIGVDYLSVGDPDVHRALLRAGVVVLEGLDLRGVEPGPYELLCLPLKLEGSDGAPARVVLRAPA